MIDFDSIWRTQDEIRTVVNAVLGECIWNLSYDERRRAIVLELTLSLDEDTVSDLCCQFPITADYDGCVVGVAIYPVIDAAILDVVFQFNRESSVSLAIGKLGALHLERWDMMGYDNFYSGHAA